MGIFETYSKRKRRRERAGQQDVYQYDDLSVAFRNQVIHIWSTALGRYFEDPYGFPQASPANELWEFIENTISRERGIFNLGVRGDNPAMRCVQYVTAADTDSALDIIELSFRTIERLVPDMGVQSRKDAGITQDSDDAIEELNGRLLEHAIGYQYVEGEIVRMDSRFIHAEAVKPALSLLNEAGFGGATEEFLNAFEHHRHGRNKEAVAEALKAFESTMKAICDARRWPRPVNATAKPLLDILFQNGIIPTEMEAHFAGLRSAMESGLPTLSNKTSRHGQGATPTSIPPHFAAYALHLAATNIVFLVQAHKAKR